MAPDVLPDAITASSSLQWSGWLKNNQIIQQIRLGGSSTVELWLEVSPSSCAAMATVGQYY
jgi:hypothetical protein